MGKWRWVVRVFGIVAVDDGVGRAESGHPWDLASRPSHNALSVNGTHIF